MERERIDFEVREAGGTWSIYAVTKDKDGKVTRESFCGQYHTKEYAEKAMRMIQPTVEKVNRPYEAKPIARVRVRVPNEKSVQNLALGLDPARMTEFFQEIILMNMFIHMLTDSFDRLDSLFGAYVDKGVKAHYKNAEKQINKLLEALYGSLFYNSEGAEEYSAVVGDSLAWKETIRKVAMHCKRRDDDWRWVELVKAIKRIFPDEACDSEDMEIYYKLRQGIVGTSVTDFN